ncbi:MAG: ribonuclease P protein component [Bacilli bacterium]|nr:ribonuclease P protein component [Bacilli bacterium]
MKRINRIRRNQDFKAIIAKRHINKSDEYIVYTDQNNFGYTRIGISVSSKLGNAIVRNKIKRQIRAMIHDLMKLDKNVDIVIIARDGFKKNSYEANKTALKKVLKIN